MHLVPCPNATKQASKAPRSTEIHWDSVFLLRLELIFAQLTYFSVCPSCISAH